MDTVSNRKYSSYSTSLALSVLVLLIACQEDKTEPKVEKSDKSKLILSSEQQRDSLEVIIGTFLGNERRNYYGDSIGDNLEMIWKLNLGSGTTNLAEGPMIWKGAGWTGQPLLVREKDEKYLVIGSYDHNLRKIDASDGQVQWAYGYDDVIKGTGTIWRNAAAEDPNKQLVILQGSRLGIENSLRSEKVYSFRGVSYFSGKELWRMNSKASRSYSRDVDASALTLGDTAYIGLENGSFISFGLKDDNLSKIEETEFLEPNVFQELKLYSVKDAISHGGNVVTEASPARIGNRIYIASGAGYVYGYDLHKREIDWVFEIGSDLDGSPVVTSDSCLLITVEKQYISGKGGVFKLDPSKKPEDCVVWFFPTGDNEFADWQGGVIGSAAVNDHYNLAGELPYMAAFMGIDGFLYLVDHKKLSLDSTCFGPNREKRYHMPELIERRKVGPSISTPIFVKNKIVAAGYSGINLFELSDNGKIVSSKKREGVFEATPIADQGKIYIASRNGYLYCLGVETREQLSSTKLNNRPQKTIPKPQTKKPTAKKPPKIKTNSSNYSESGQLTQGFYLVAGAFGVKGNAEKKLAEFKSKGIDAFIGSGPNGLNYVIVGQGNTKVEAEKVQIRLREEYGVNAWMYNKR